MNKRVLIISYYWPPAGGSGVQRWLKFVKYLGCFGIDPIIYTPENPELMAVDKGLLEEIPEGTVILKKRILEPYSFYKVLTGKKGESIKPGFINEQGKDGKLPLKERASLFIRSNFFIPDPKCFWIIPSIRFLNDYIKGHPVDLIISTGPPHSMHLIAKEVSRKCKIPWIADFRDPWTEMYNFKYLKHTLLVRAVHKKMERSVVQKADGVVVVTQQMKKEFLRLNPKRVEVITNGYDESDFDKYDGPLEKEFTITYTGLFFKDRNPENLWIVLGDILKQDESFRQDLRLRIIGQTDPEIMDDIRKWGLEKNCTQMSYMPHSEVIKWQQSAQLLLLSSGKEPEARGILTGKFFEYLASRRPILAFGYKDGDLADAISETNAGAIFEYEEIDSLRVWILDKYKLYKERGISETGGEIEKYSRKSLCSDLVNLINEIIENK